MSRQPSGCRICLLAFYHPKVAVIREIRFPVICKGIVLKK
ncbi:uncharacterized protein Dmul_37670 [Desulfococcus multivorans]|nr:uncharacterized protein Dmul_37670 [Desulfococcus multivorans]